MSDGSDVGAGVEIMEEGLEDYPEDHGSAEGGGGGSHDQLTLTDDEGEEMASDDVEMGDTTGGDSGPPEEEETEEQKSSRRVSCVQVIRKWNSGASSGHGSGSGNFGAGGTAAPSGGPSRGCNGTAGGKGSASGSSPLVLRSLGLGRCGSLEEVTWELEGCLAEVVDLSDNELDDPTAALFLRCLPRCSDLNLSHNLVGLSEARAVSALLGGPGGGVSQSED
eukprot:RCo035037